MIELAERLAEFCPGSLKQSFFCTSGSEANETAILLARMVTKRRKVLALNNSLHGRTHLTLGLTGLSFWRCDPFPYSEVCFVPNPYCYRCEFGADNPQDCQFLCLVQIEKIIQERGPEEIAALIAEPIQGNGGIIVPPPGYFQEMKKILDKYGILFIADEVQTGLNRTGKAFAIEHWGVEPDILTMAKALANGLPIGVVITRPEIAQFYSRPGASTFGGNPVVSAAALATLEVHQEEALDKKAEERGRYFKDQLLRLMERHPIIGEVRGKGLMLGAELINRDRTPAGELLDHVLERLKDQGILAGKSGPGRNVLTFQPPLVITEEDIDYTIKRLEDILGDL